MCDVVQCREGVGCKGACTKGGVHPLLSVEARDRFSKRSERFVGATSRRREGARKMRSSLKLARMQGRGPPMLGTWTTPPL